MSRTITLPAREVRQEIKSLQEYPGASVVVIVGAVNDAGDWLDDLVPPFSVHIDGADYAELTAAEPPAWAPDKPAGTYRNEDLWHFVDKLTQE